MIYNLLRISVNLYTNEIDVIIYLILQDVDDLQHFSEFINILILKLSVLGISFVINAY